MKEHSWPLSCSAACWSKAFIVRVNEGSRLCWSSQSSFQYRLRASQEEHQLCGQRTLQKVYFLQETVEYNLHNLQEILREVFLHSVYCTLNLVHLHYSFRQVQQHVLENLYQLFVY